jgi:hypothetical protein
MDTLNQSTQSLAQLMQDELRNLSASDIESAQRSKERTARMYDDFGDTKVQQNMVVHNLETDMY